jgi:long-chain acyl-CoA synthetase
MTNDPILSAFEALAAAHPQDVLMLCLGKTASIGDIDRLADDVRRRASEQDVPAGAIVGLAAPNGPAFAAGYLGLRRAGFHVLLMEARTPLPERQRIQRSLRCSGVMVVDTGWPASAEEFHISLDPKITPPNLPDAISTIRLTSGSTGEPRGIGVTSQSLLTDDAAIRSTMELENERALAAIPLSHAYGFSSLFMPALTQGWPLVFPDGISPFAAIRAADEGQITFLPTVPAYLEALLKMDTVPPLPPTLGRVITAGAPLRPETARRFRKAFGRPVHVFYGASEVGGICYDRRGDAGERGTLGTPLEGVTVTLAPHGELTQGQGIVEVHSPAAAVGYLPENDDSLGGGRFLTSDIGSFVGGELQLLGRKDSIVNVQGKKINPREIEEVLENLDGVGESVVMGIRNTSSMENFLAAIVAGDNLPPMEEILGWCRHHLAPHKIPRRILRVAALPRTPRSKLDRALVRKWLESR